MNDRLVEWRSTPAEVRLSPHEIHIWKSKIDEQCDAGRQFDCYSGDHLSESELLEAESFRFERDRRKYLQAHAFLHRVLNRYLRGVGEDRQSEEAGGVVKSRELAAGGADTDSEKSLEFQRGEYGKPYLSAPPSLSRLRFNMSHSGEMVIIAIAMGREVGIDIEKVRDNSHRDGVIRRFFSESEVDFLFSLPADKRKNHFFTLWARKEALAKAQGKSLFTVLPTNILTHRWKDWIYILPKWSLTDISAFAGYACAVCIEAKSPDLNFVYFSWDFNSRSLKKT